MNEEFILNDSEPSAPQHSLLTSVALHLLPAVLVMAFYLFAAPAAIRAGFPPEIALMVGFLLFGIPWQLGYLLYLGKERNGTLSLRGVVLYREPIPKWQYVVFPFLLIIFAFVVLVAVAPLKEYLAQNVFGWMPTYMLPDGIDAYPPFARSAILFTLILRLIFDGIVNPTVEELYFRGYLLPRISRFGWFAVVLNVFLFSVQHYWQPYNVPLIFLLQLAMISLVWWKKNIYISIFAHCAANTLGALLSIIGFLSS